jgi:hypothetical protein
MDFLTVSMAWQKGKGGQAKKVLCRTAAFIVLYQYDLGFTTFLALLLRTNRAPL